MRSTQLVILAASDSAQIGTQLRAQRAELCRVLAGAHQRALESYERLAGFALQAFDGFGFDLCWLDHAPRRQRRAPSVNRI